MNRRLILGFSLAPLAPCLLAATVAAAKHGQIVAIPIGTLLYAIFAYPLAFALGIPAYLLMARLGWVSMPQVASAGFFLGCISGILILLTLGGAEWQRILVLNKAIAMPIVMYGVYGLLTACVFWWLALRPGLTMHSSGTRLRRAP